MRFYKTLDTLVFDENIKYPTNLKGINKELLEVANSSLRSLIELENKLDYDFTRIINVFRKREALYSSSIEGNIVTLNEYLIKSALETNGNHYKQKNNESLNEYASYKELFNLEDLIENWKLSKDKLLTDKQLKTAHKVLFDELENTSSYHSSKAGEYKTTSNFIAKSNGFVTYVPCGVDMINSEFSKLNKYINQIEYLYIDEADLMSNQLIRSAVIHSHFERIHPFNDGNGRVGRLLIPLYFYTNGITKNISIFLSNEIFKQQQIYYEKLKSVEKNKDYSEFVNWYLEIFNKFANNFFQLQINYLLSKSKVNKLLISKNRNFFNIHLDTVTQILLTNKYITRKSFVIMFNNESKMEIDYNHFNQTILKNLLDLDLIKLYSQDGKEKIYKSTYFIDNNTNE